jgi:membrane protease YdiL (CAAX protease family)
MDPRRVLALALGSQALLVALALAGERVLGIRASWGNASRDVPLGLAAAAGLAAANYALLRLGGSGWLSDGVRRVYREVLVPLFGRLETPAIVLIAIAAGLGEEWFFRGVIQPWLGWIGGSLVFGAAHVGGRRMLAFGVWASVMGLALGGLAILTGGLLAPAIAHGVYDALALEYIRRQPKVVDAVETE